MENPQEIKPPTNMSLLEAIRYYDNLIAIYKLRILAAIEAEKNKQKDKK